MNTIAMVPEYAISIRQPWAWLYLTYKPVENRTWRIGRQAQYGVYQTQKGNFNLELPARVYIHAAKKYLPEDYKAAFNIVYEIYGEDETQWIKAAFLNHLEVGAIIGEVTIVRQITETDDPLVKPWFTGPYGFLRENPTLYDRPIPCRGELGFFRVDMAEIKRRAGIFD